MVLLLFSASLPRSNSLVGHPALLSVPSESESPSIQKCNSGKSSIQTIFLVSMSEFLEHSRTGDSVSEVGWKGGTLLRQGLERGARNP